MKRQLNFWSKPIGAPETDLVNTSLSIKDDQFTVVFRKPGHVKPISYIVFNLNEEESFDLRKAFELSGCRVFQDEMDERIYFANIAMQREHAKSTERFAITIGWSVLFYIACMFISAVLLKIYVITSLCLSLSAAIIFCIFLRKKFYNETKVLNNE